MKGALFPLGAFVVRHRVALSVLAVCLALAGCGTPKLPARIEVPVQVPCRVTVPAAPVWATDSLAPDAGIWDQVKALLAERQQRIAHQVKLEAAAKACQ